MSATDKQISILGCGWLGLPLLRHLIADGYSVSGSSRDPATLAAITGAGGRAFRVDLPGEVPPGFVPDPFGILIVALPPRGRALGAAATDHYLAALASLPRLRSRSAPGILFLSTTGVYGDATGRVTEATPPAPATASARAVAAAERWLADLPAHYAVLRLAGLVGPHRHPGRFFGGRGRPVSDGDAPVNLVHQDDVIAAVRLLLERGFTRGTVLNVCAATHPPKGEFYTAAARRLGLDVAGTVGGGAAGKRIASDGLRQMGWQPTYDDLTAALDDPAAWSAKNFF